MPIKRGVSLYSLQEPYFLREMDLEACIAKVPGEIGVDGIEYLPEQMPLPSYPYYSQKDIDMWHGWMDKYKTTPRCLGSFCDHTMFKNRDLTKGECIDIIVEDLKRANQLGFPILKTSMMLMDLKDVSIFEECLPFAEFYGVQIAVEIHSPRSIHSWYTQDYLEMLHRTGTKYAGFIIDLGIFNIGIPVPVIKRALREGGNEKIIDYIADAFKNKVDVTEDDVKKMGGGRIELGVLQTGKRAIYDDPEWLREVLPFSQHIHGKFFEMDENYEEASIDYARPLAVIKKFNWDGYIMSEYEGQRHYTDIGCEIYMDPFEQCRRHHVMIKRLLGEA